MPSSFNWGDVKEKRAFQVCILLPCWLRLRPIKVRKVWTSGTKGIGRGVRGAFIR